MDELLKDSQDTMEYLKQLGCQVIEMWECTWVNLQTTDPDVQQFYTNRPRKDCTKMTEMEIIDAVRDGELFGMVECSLHAPEHLKDYFSEMTPIFKNVDIGLEDVSGVMKEFAVERGLLKKPRRNLIGSYFAEKILLATPLLQ